MGAGVSTPTPADQSRRESFAVCGPTVELDVQLGAGAVAIELVDDLDTVDVAVDVGSGTWWQQGLSGVLSIFGAAQPEESESAGVATEALRTIAISFSAQRSRLTVRAPKSGVARAVALELHVRAPSAAEVFVRTSTARVDVTGRAARVDVSTGSGEVSVQEVAEGTEVRTGSGDVRLGALAGGGRARTGSGNITVDSLTGDLELTSGSGDLRIGIGAGVAVELDLRSGSGSVRSELAFLDAPAAGGGPQLHGRTGSGTVLVHGAR